MVTVGSLFSGIGGLELGLERAGMRVVWQVEKNDYCNKVLAKHWPDVARYGDVRDVGVHNLEPVDLICGGFPCQPFSVAGKQRGEADSRFLWPEYARIIRELKPRWVLAENVPGLLSAGHGRDFGSVLRDLAECGYDAEWQVLSAAQFGASHLRRRVFIIAYPHGHRCLGWENQQELRQERQGEVDTCEVGVVADPNEAGFLGARLPVGQKWDASTDTAGRGTLVFGAAARPSGQWALESGVGRVADGVPARLDRLRGLGNAVVPQVAEWVGRQIMEVA